jgi:hypothetical protein
VLILHTSDSHKLFVGQLPKDADEEFVRELFAAYGEISGVYIIKRKNPDTPKYGCAFVKYTDRSMAQAAIDALDGEFQLEGVEKPIRVKFADRHQHGSYQHHRTASGNRMHGHGGIPPAHDIYMNHRGYVVGGGSPYHMGSPHHPGNMSPVAYGPGSVTPEEYSQQGHDGTPPTNMATPGVHPPPLMPMDTILQFRLLLLPPIHMPCTLIITRDTCMGHTVRISLILITQWQEVPENEAEDLLHLSHRVHVKVPQVPICLYIIYRSTLQMLILLQHLTHLATLSLPKSMSIGTLESPKVSDLYPMIQLCLQNLLLSR